MRYFRASLAVYEDACAQLDAAYGYPNYETKTLRTLRLASELPVDAQGRVYINISAEFCEYELPSQIIARGDVEEITAEQYLALLPADAAI